MLEDYELDINDLVNNENQINSSRILGIKVEIKQK